MVRKIGKDFKRLSCLSLKELLKSIRLLNIVTIDFHKNICSQTSEVLETSEVFREIIYLKVYISAVPKIPPKVYIVPVESIGESKIHCYFRLDIAFREDESRIRKGIGG